MYKERKIIKKIVHFLEQSLIEEKDQVASILESLLVLLAFGNYFKEDGQNMFASDFSKVNGGEALKKLANLQNQYILSLILMFQAFLESGGK